MAEGEGVEPSTVRSARFSGPVACRHAPPSEMVVPARLERATPAIGERCSAPLSYGTETVRARAHGHHAQIGQGGWIRTNGLLRPRQALLARLSYTLLALRREIESLSPDGQSGRLTRCVTERDRISSSAGKGTWCVWAETAKCRENAQTFSRHSPGLGPEGPGYCSGLARRAEESAMSVSIGRTTAATLFAIMR
jgi:hypothetical protein